MFHFRPFSIFVFLVLGFFLIGCQGDTEVSEVKEESRAHPATSATNKTKALDPNRKIVTGHLDAGGLDWMTVEEAGQIENKEEKKFLIDVYTDWCGWCKIMDKRTFSDPELKAYLTEKYHLVKFNAEQHDPISFNGKTYEWVAQGKNGVNKLAFEVIGTSLSYPTLVFLDENLNKIKHSTGYKKPDQLMAELKLIDNS